VLVCNVVTNLLSEWFQRWPCFCGVGSFMRHVLAACLRYYYRCMLVCDVIVVMPVLTVIAVLMLTVIAVLMLTVMPADADKLEDTDRTHLAVFLQASHAARSNGFGLAANALEAQQRSRSHPSGRCHGSPSRQPTTTGHLTIFRFFGCEGSYGQTRAAIVATACIWVSSGPKCTAYNHFLGCWRPPPDGEDSACHKLCPTNSPLLTDPVVCNPFNSLSLPQP
jgi:hypothetical protein